MCHLDTIYNQVIFLSVLGYLFCSQITFMHLNEASEWDGFGLQQVLIFTKISPYRELCGSLEGIHVYVQLLCFTRIFWWPWHWNYLQFYCGFLLVRGWEEKGKFTLILYKALCRNPMALVSIILSSDMMKTCGESTCRTDLLRHRTSLMHLICKKLKRLRRSVSIKIEFTDKRTKRKSSFKIMAESFFKH